MNLLSGQEAFRRGGLGGLLCHRKAFRVVPNPLGRLPGPPRNEAAVEVSLTGWRFGGLLLALRLEFALLSMYLTYHLNAILKIGGELLT